MEFLVEPMNNLNGWCIFVHNDCSAGDNCNVKTCGDCDDLGCGLNCPTLSCGARGCIGVTELPWGSGGII